MYFIKETFLILVLIIAVTPIAFLLMPLIVIAAVIGGLFLFVKWIDKRVEIRN